MLPYYGYLAAVRRDLGSLAATPMFLKRDPTASGGAGGGDAMMAQQTPFEELTVEPKMIFPTEGQYVVFVNFQPVDSGELTPRRAGRSRLGDNAGGKPGSRSFANAGDRRLAGKPATPGPFGCGAG